MEENSRVRGLYTIVKIIDNNSRSSANRLVTMTLGKYGFINTDYDGPSPRHDEFWLVRIDREIKANTLQGCFVLTPVRRVDRADIDFLVPGCGQYTEFYESGIRYVLPKDKSKYYLLPLEHRKRIKDVRSVIVVNFALAKYSQSDRYFHFPSEPGYDEEQASYRSPEQAYEDYTYGSSHRTDIQTPYDGTWK